MITINDLKPGDIILMKRHGKAFHAMLYAPVPGENGDLIHVGYGKRKSGIVKSTLSHTLDNFSHRTDFQFEVLRCKTIDGNAIAQQAELWLRQGVPFDERRFSDLVEREYNHVTETSPQLNAFEYLKYAARRNTAPLKPPIKYPYNNSGNIAMALVMMVHPANEYPSMTPFLVDRLRGRTDSPERPKGFMCVGFVLAVLGAAALNDFIQPVSAATGWVSFKYGAVPQQASPYRDALLAARQEAGCLDNGRYSGLHSLMTAEQLNHFDLANMADRLTRAVINVNPQHASVQGFLNEVNNDKEHWFNLGLMDKAVLRADFDKQKYNREGADILQAIDGNREHFRHDFPGVMPQKQVKPAWYSMFLSSGSSNDKNPMADHPRGGLKLT